jgi:hypothetical protein
MRADVRREPAAMTEDRRLHLRAQVMVSRHALAAVHAATRIPSDTDALSDRQPLGIRPQGRDATGDFVAESRGILRIAPIIVQGRKIGVTQSAVFDRYFNVLRSERSEINGFENDRLLRPFRNPRLICRRLM